VADEEQAEARRRPALSPSRAADFKQCPLLYRFRAVDRLPEPPAPAAVRGTVVHAVLERLLALPAPERTRARGSALVGEVWAEIVTGQPDLVEALRAQLSPMPPATASPRPAATPRPTTTSAGTTLPGSDSPRPTAPPRPTAAAAGTAPPGRTRRVLRWIVQRVRGVVGRVVGAGPADPLAEWLASTAPLLDTYFALEDPRTVAPRETELLVETELEAGVPLRGYLDRLDVDAEGAVRIVDYKTGRAPREGSESRALFQMKFYALALLTMHGTVPAQLRLVYLGSGGAQLTYTPDGEELERFGRILEALWTAIREADRTGDFRPNRGPGCGWCAHKEICPAWGGTPPPYPGWPELRGEAPTATFGATP
jgi:putative RecB family exonuclease